MQTFLNFVFTEYKGATFVSKGIRDLAAHLTQGCQTPVEKAVRIHDYVREIPFGFTAWFDAASPTQTVKVNRGHCNPKGALFVELLRETGLEARQHVVNIDNRILRGCFSVPPPSPITHSYAEVRLNDRWVKTDSYIVDTQHFRAAKARLEKEGEKLGYGVHAKGTNEWDGNTDAFSQFADPGGMLIEDMGVVGDWQGVVKKEGYANKAGGLGVSTWLLPATLVPYGAFQRWINKEIDEVTREVGQSIPQRSGQL
ncbi:hypothetical protein KFL_003610130 [Klebsormidium nitens]|uniref:Transglutaminase-like domain-containing protein n=1 Tax=Klebsormidium nitens TaxID=105231 RepID=A0A1Y1IDQ8_KLENI|nr:hypothetical protein KFL_003610130 [Klebsormidium nitens]|eukprot:GAQ87569.1 hypothetical protein KFL_003610130 [Klebsormidium nitens]